MFEQESSSDINETLIEEALTNIWKITLKIKRELDIINDLVKENGNFCSAVIHTNQSLMKILEEKGIDLSAIEEEKENNEDSNILESENESDIINPLVPVINRFSKIP
ncbi:hypothetical protein M0804_003949 [Polistes exclamans]|nr:hypothetical protein M0804_003949 [Polistes exclamans]